MTHEPDRSGIVLTFFEVSSPHKKTTSDEQFVTPGHARGRRPSVGPQKEPGPKPRLNSRPPVEKEGMKAAILAPIVLGLLV